MAITSIYFIRAQDGLNSTIVNILSSSTSFNDNIINIFTTIKIIIISISIINLAMMTELVSEAVRSQEGRNSG